MSHARPLNAPKWVDRAEKLKVNRGFVTIGTQVADNNKRQRTGPP
jgi:hypothetical protein